MLVALLLTSSAIFQFASACSSDTDCRYDQVCASPPIYTRGRLCMSTKSLFQECIADAQCRKKVANSECKYNNALDRICECEYSFKAVGGECIENYCYTVADCTKPYNTCESNRCTRRSKTANGKDDESSIYFKIGEVGMGLLILTILVRCWRSRVVVTL
ncbi:hypothetical protein HDE_03764 [Halotydeus destructor]|nr:hypothetical protein HDE_03764 [Halotydeus destructor]